MRDTGHYHPIGAIPEVLEDRRDVLLVAPGDRATLTDRIVEVLADPALQQGLSDRGLDRFRVRFTLEAFLLDLMGIYERRFGLELAPRVPGSHSTTRQEPVA